MKLMEITINESLSIEIGYQTEQGKVETTIKDVFRTLPGQPLIFKRGGREVMKVAGENCFFTFLSFSLTVKPKMKIIK